MHIVEFLDNEFHCDCGYCEIDLPPYKVKQRAVAHASANTPAILRERESANAA